MNQKGLCSGPKLDKDPSDPSSFWDNLEIQGGSWMCEGWREDNEDKDLTWLVEGMKDSRIE